MSTITGQINFAVAGVSLAGTISRTADTPKGHDSIVCAAAKTGQLTTRTNNTDGAITLTAGHGLSTGTYDVHWSGGSRFGVSHTISVNADTITGGSGDNLPDNLTNVFVSVRTEVDSAWDGDNLYFIGAVSDVGQANLSFVDGGSAVLFSHRLPNGGEPWFWCNNWGTASPITGNAVAKIYCSAGTAAITRVKVGLLLDETP